MESQDKRRPPLQGVRVVDFSRMLPGPWCTQMLGDFGAEVIKVEQPPVGDLGRHNAPNFRKESVYFNTVNLNKESIDLDLSREDDRAMVRRLLETADVVVESFRTGVTRRLGIDYDAVRKISPAVIYCSITGFGQSGPFSQIPGHDLVIQCTTGSMGVTTGGAGVPSNPGFQAADYAAATYAVIGILAALQRRSVTGEGAHLDISMFDALFSMSNVLSNAALAHLAGFKDAPQMELWGRNPRYATYPTKDGKAVAVSLLEAHIWKHFCEMIGRPDLIAADETARDRHTHHGDRAARYREAIAEVCASRPRDELVAWMLENDVPIMPVYTPDEAINSEHAQARGLVEWIEHPVEGRIPVLANPLARSGLTTGVRQPAPQLGADRERIMSKLKSHSVR